MLSATLRTDFRHALEFLNAGFMRCHPPIRNDRPITEPCARRPCDTPRPKMTRESGNFLTLVNLLHQFCRRLVSTCARDLELVFPAQVVRSQQCSSPGHVPPIESTSDAPIPSISMTLRDAKMQELSLGVRGTVGVDAAPQPTSPSSRTTFRHTPDTARA